MNSSARAGARLIVAAVLSLAALPLVGCAATGGSEARDASNANVPPLEDAAVLDASAAPDAGASPSPDAGPIAVTDAGPAPAPDAGPPPPAVLSVEGCDSANASCTCTDLGGANACTHTFGGVYANLGCSGSYQCCDGAWRKGLSVCGSCLCSDTTGEAGCRAGDDVTSMCHPVFTGTASAIPDDVRADMTGKSWKPDMGCPAFSQLRLLRLSYWTFDGGVAEGELVVHQSVASEVIDVFEALFDARFPIERMQRVDAYDADDDASMAANNTSAFNCRLTTSGTQLSQHSYGKAIDINPLRNPYVTSGGTVYPPAGSSYVDRSEVREGMIVQPGPVVDAFDDVAWGWGGRWPGTKDYQHFSENGL